jgi:hypothetical protein
VLLERGRAEDGLAGLVEDDRRAVEEQLVVAADLIHVHERHAVP